jgi:hypothetical protein
MISGAVAVLPRLFPRQGSRSLAMERNRAVLSHISRATDQYHCRCGIAVANPVALTLLNRYVEMKPGDTTRAFECDKEW